MRPEIWGPGFWHLLFAAAWRTSDQERLLPQLTELLELVPDMLPCSKCRANHRAHVAAIAKGRPLRFDNGLQAFRTLHTLKTMVSKSIARAKGHAPCPPIALQRLMERYLVRGDVVDAVLVADTLLLVAIDVHERGAAELTTRYCRFCALLRQLLPVPASSPLHAGLATTQGAVVQTAYRTCKLTRRAAGHAAPPLSYFQQAALL